jgi:putative membrane protein
MLRVALAAFHLVVLGLGLWAVLTRSSALREPLTTGSLQRALRADAVWGIAFALWLGTGLWRLFGETEKTLGYYTHNTLFLTKMALLVLILALEVWPMLTLIQWRRALGRGTLLKEAVTPMTARRIALFSHIQALLVVLMIFAACGMARGFGVS